MSQYTSLYLKPREDRRLQAGHLWIYSNEIDTAKSPLKAFAAGELVQVANSRDKVLGIGYINPHNLLAARLLTSEKNAEINEKFFLDKFAIALQLRQAIFDRPFYRLIYGEGDSLPGLIVDRYGDHLVMQITTAGMENLSDLVISALEKILQPRSIILRNDSAIRELEGLTRFTKLVRGDVPEKIEIIENNVKFLIPALTGQKTGWFYDHRDNRAKLARYVKDKRVLDVFSYMGGWGIQAAVFGAAHVACIDSSLPALQQLEENAAINNVASKVNVIHEDTFVALKHLKESQEKFDVIILDPPAFIKKRKDQAAGEAAYQRLNELALHCLAKDGILVSASCSLHLPIENLIDIVRRASINSECAVQILERGFQGPDHPVHLAIPETAYLKALICRKY